MEKSKKEIITIAVCGLLIGVISVVLVVLGNPANMGFCIACFLRDTAGGLHLHNAAVVQYVRPEIIGLVLGSFILSLVRKEFKPRGGSAPLTRFILGFFIMIGCLVFLGCPFRMILRLAGGDLNALVGLAGFTAGVLGGVFFLNRGYSLGRTYKQTVVEGAALPVVQIVLLIAVIVAPALFVFSESGPGSKHASLIVSLVAGLLVGGMAQLTRFCMVGGIRDLFLFKQGRLLTGSVCVFIAALIGNLFTGRFNLSFAQYNVVAHSDHLWNFLGMLIVGLGCVLIGGCPLRQLVMAGEGNSDSAVTVLGLLAGAAFAHNFKTASGAAAMSGGEVTAAGGATQSGKVLVIVGLIVMLIIAYINTFRRGEKK